MRPDTRFTPALSSEMNVTPMIDVLLVLLIIFMAAIPSMRKAIDAQLPDHSPTTGEGAPSIVLELADDGSMRVNQQLVAAGGLHAALRAVYDGRRDKVLFVKGSRKVRYATVLAAMDVARGAGVEVIGLP